MTYCLGQKKIYKTLAVISVKRFYKIDIILGIKPRLLVQNEP